MEHELKKHVHNILNEVSNKRTSIRKRLGEIAIEMLIIVFAVSFAVFMERQREHNHDQQEVKEFLVGLKTDLQNDIIEMNEDKLGYQKILKWFSYFSDEPHPNIDTLQNYQWIIWNNIGLLINNGRYEGFKASGKINTITNAQLRNKILDLYQETIVALTNNTTGYNTRKKEIEKMVLENKGDYISLILYNDIFKAYCKRLSYVKEIVRRYNLAIRESQQIINLIEKEYPE